jgi:hypothetical protein
MGSRYPMSDEEQAALVRQGVGDGREQGLHALALICRRADREFRPDWIGTFHSELEKARVEKPDTISRLGRKRQITYRQAVLEGRRQVVRMARLHCRANFHVNHHEYVGICIDLLERPKVERAV